MSSSLYIEYCFEQVRAAAAERARMLHVKCGIARRALRCVIHACMRIAFVPVLAVIYMLYVNLNNRVTANASIY